MSPLCRRMHRGNHGAPRADHLYAVDVDTPRSTAIWRMLSHRASEVGRPADALGFISRASVNVPPTSPRRARRPTASAANVAPRVSRLVLNVHRASTSRAAPMAAPLIRRHWRLQANGVVDEDGEIPVLPDLKTEVSKSLHSYRRSDVFSSRALRCLICSPHHRDEAIPHAARRHDGWRGGLVTFTMSKARRSCRSFPLTR